MVKAGREGIARFLIMIKPAKNRERERNKHKHWMQEVKPKAVMFVPTEIAHSISGFPMIPTLVHFCHFQYLELTWLDQPVSSLVNMFMGIQAQFRAHYT